jgi:AbiV family abortive infection protein
MPKKKILSKRQNKVLSQHDRDAQLCNLSRGASKALLNAEELFQEANLLRSQGALSRALFLHQISLEECGKIEILGGCTTGLFMGFDLDFQELLATLATHKAKNYANSYMLPSTNEELGAKKRGDWRRCIEVFERQQAKFHTDSNSAKNASLYVDYENGHFTTPKEKITETMVAEIAKRNSEFLMLVRLKVEMLSRWQTDPEKVQGMIGWFSTRAEELKSQLPNDPEQVLSILMQEMLERTKATCYTS